MPRNASTQRGYSGINVLILWGSVIEHGFFRTELAHFFARPLGPRRPCQEGVSGERPSSMPIASRRTTNVGAPRRPVKEPGAVPFLKRFNRL